MAPEMDVAFGDHRTSQEPSPMYPQFIRATSLISRVCVRLGVFVANIAVGLGPEVGKVKCRRVEKLLRATFA